MTGWLCPCLCFVCTCVFVCVYEHVCFCVFCMYVCVFECLRLCLCVKKVEGGLANEVARIVSLKVLIFIPSFFLFPIKYRWHTFFTFRCKWGWKITTNLMDLLMALIGLSTNFWNLLIHNFHVFTKNWRSVWNIWEYNCVWLYW